MAMHADDRLVDVAHMLAQVGDQIGVLLRHRVPDGIGDVHRGGASLDRGLHDFGEKLGFGARGILGGELDVRDHRLRLGHTLDGQADDFLVGLLELVLAVDLGCRKEDVDAGALPGWKK